MSFVVVDTDVASAILRERVPPKLAARLAGKTICVTFVTVGELVKWTEVRSWGSRKLAELDAWLDHTVVLAYDDEVAVTWGRLHARSGAGVRARPTIRGLPRVASWTGCRWRPSTPRTSPTSPDTTGYRRSTCRRARSFVHFRRTVEASDRW